MRMSDRHGATASEIAEKSVAEAAIISAARVHALCQHARNERGPGEPECPEMTAAELKRHVEEGPASLQLDEPRQFKGPAVPMAARNLPPEDFGGIRGAEERSGRVERSS